MIKSFLSWVFGILFLLGAIKAVLRGDIIDCITLGIPAIILIPSIWNYIEDAFDFKLNAGIKALIVCMSLFVRIGYVGYKTTGEGINESIEIMQKEWKTNSSEIIKNPSEKDKKAVTEFGNLIDQEIKNCTKAMEAETMEHNTSRACTESYNNISRMDIPSFLPDKVKNLLFDVKKYYIYADLTVIEFMKRT